MKQINSTRSVMLVRLQGYMTLAFLFMLFLVGCSKDSLTTETVFQANGDFFDLQRSRGDLTLRESYPISANPILRSVVSDLSAKNAAQNFTNNYISRVGYPMWLESKIYQDGPTGPPVVFIPFARDGADSLSGLLVAYRNPLNGQYRYNPMSRERLLSVTDAEYPQYRYYLKQFVQMNEKIFRKSSAGMSSRICRGEGLLGQYTPPGVINPVECPWRLINLCYDDDRRITYIAGHLPIHLDHDMDGIPNWEDQDWNDFLSRHPNINNFEQAVRGYWEENMEDLYGEYDDFWDAYSYPELNGGLEIDFSDWIDFWEDFWDDISDGWDDFWDWVDYQFEPEPDCWDPVQGGSLETREVHCDWLYVRDCDGDWRNGFDDVTVCVGCGDSDDCQSEIFKRTEATRIKLKYNLSATVETIIRVGNEQCWCAPSEYYIEHCVLEGLKLDEITMIKDYYRITLSLNDILYLAENCSITDPQFEKCVLAAILADFEDRHQITFTYEQREWLIDKSGIVGQLETLAIEYPKMDLNYVVDILSQDLGVTLFDFINTYEEFLDLDNPVDDIPPPIINNGIQVVSIENYIGSSGTAVAYILPAETLDEDLTYGTNPNLNGIRQEMINRIEAYKWARMKDLFIFTSILSPYNMAPIALDFVYRFHENNSADYFNSSLGDNLCTHNAITNFVKKFGERVNHYLAFTNGNINNMNLNLPRSIRPIFNTKYDRYHGYQILINDIEKAHVEKLDYIYYPITKSWQGTFVLDITDHFGLDKRDVLKYQYKSAGFAAWWLLQHQLGYKPFKTRIKLKFIINGQL